MSVPNDVLQAPPLVDLVAERLAYLLAGVGEIGGGPDEHDAVDESEFAVRFEGFPLPMGKRP
jgi:hypothetical protein